MCSGRQPSKLNILCCRPVLKGRTYYFFTPFWDATPPPMSMAQARLKKYANSLHFREQAKVFNSPSTVDVIVLAGENALVSLYGRKPWEKLDCMRYQRYCEKLATNSSQMQPQNLPPTSAAARCQNLRVYLQVKQSKGENEGMSLEEYGWKVTGGQVLPRMTDLPVAPESLLQMIRCNCSSDCASARCACGKHGLQCSLACGQCRSTNSPIQFDEEGIPALSNNDTIFLERPKGVMRTTLGARLFHAFVPALWNSLPAHFRTTDSLLLFKKSLKTYHFKLAFQIRITILSASCILFIYFLFIHSFVHSFIHYSLLLLLILLLLFYFSIL